MNFPVWEQKVMGAGDLVGEYDFIGDAGDDAAGKNTQVQIILNQIHVVYRQVSGCVPSKVIQTMMARRVISPAALGHLASQVAFDDQNKKKMLERMKGDLNH